MRSSTLTVITHAEDIVKDKDMIKNKMNSIIKKEMILL